MNCPLTLNEVMEKADKISAEEKIKISYFSKPRCLKSYSDHTVIKQTSLSGRIGLDYSMLESVQKRNADTNYVPKQRNVDTTWVIDKKIQHNNKTGSDLLVFYPEKDTKSDTSILLIYPDGKEEIIDYDKMRVYCGSAGQPRIILDEDGNPKHTEIMYINANNIYSIERELDD